MKKLILFLITMVVGAVSFGAYRPTVTIEGNVYQASLTTNALAGGGNYDSTILDLREYSQVQTHISSDQSGTIIVEFCSDDQTNVTRTLSVPYVGGSGFQMFSAPAFTPYVRYQYTNGASANTNFFYETKFLKQALSPQVLGANAFISPLMVASLGRNIIVGVDDAGTFRNVPVDTEGHLKVNLNDPTTSFGDLRVAELTPQVHVTFSYNINSDILTVTTNNGGLVQQTNSMALLQSSSSTNGTAKFESRKTVKYRSGLGTLVRFTGMFSIPQDNATQVIGVGDDTDGFFVGYNGDEFGFLVRRDGVDTWTAQTNWNVDVLDGSNGSYNPSHMALTSTNLNVYQISYQWLGAGEIELDIENPATGNFTPVHRVQYANNNILPSIFNPDLSLYAKVQNTGNSTNVTIQSASMAGFVEGKSVVTGESYAKENTLSVGSGETMILSIRNKTNYVGRANKVRCNLGEIAVGSDKAQITTFKLYRDATLGGSPNWQDINTDNSVIEFDTNGTFSASGKLLWTGTIGGDSGETYDVEHLDIIIAPDESISLTAKSTAGATADIKGALIWREDF